MRRVYLIFLSTMILTSLSQSAWADPTDSAANHDAPTRPGRSFRIEARSGDGVSATQSTIGVQELRVTLTDSGEPVPTDAQSESRVYPRSFEAAVSVSEDGQGRAGIPIIHVEASGGNLMSTPAPAGESPSVASGVTGHLFLDRNTLVDRQGQVGVSAMAEAMTIGDHGRLRFFAGGEAGLSYVSNRTGQTLLLPYAQGVAGLRALGCLALGPQERGTELCGDVETAAAAGVIRVALNGAASLTFQQRVNNRGSRVFFGGRASGELSLDLAGGHGAAQIGGTAGFAY